MPGKILFLYFCGMKKLVELFNNINYTRVGYHVLFWITITLFYDLASSYIYDRPVGTTLILDLLFYTPTDLLGVYFTIYFLMPVFIHKRKYWQFILSFLLFFSILIFILSLPLEYIGLKYYYSGKGESCYNYGNFVSKYVLWAITSKLMIIGLASSIKFLKYWTKTQRREQHLLEEKLVTEIKLKEAELNYLKSQINPHFLFNSLNNLYSLTLEKSDLAPKVVLKISGLLDYMLYECNEQFIDLEKETENLRNYVELQKIRYGENINIELNIGEITDEDKIAPLLLLPFVENAFKHGLDKNVGTGFIKVNMELNGQHLVFKTENSKVNLPETTSSGIGLENVKKRLELQYANNYNLNITEADERFIVELSIDLG